jgi:hypothetical protein
MRVTKETFEPGTTKKNVPSRTRSLKELLVTKENWLKGVLAMDDQGKAREPNPESTRLVKFCIVGAAMQIYGRTFEFQRTLSRMADVIESEWRWRVRSTSYGSDWCKCAVFNNDSDTTFEDIQLLIEKAGV